ncbi:hypothetical protein H4R18_001440 [Coemansia javaensis]|uniref:Uncharacterized protein n=1 Tax=Coemansia javaensis TaxID=2761396 RepID=A0A9W8LK89_9FUNG|nr:hypothetical protein H4R18_001440 [Coemansia javaensis]
MGIIAAAAHARAPRRAEIAIEYVNAPLVCLEKALWAIRRVSSEWGGVRTLRISVEAFDWDFEDSANAISSVSGAGIRQIGSALLALMPGVRELVLGEPNDERVSSTICSAVAGAFAGQLHTIRDPCRITLPGGVMLRHLEVSYWAASWGLLPHVCADTLEVLKIRGTSSGTEPWHAFGADSNAAAIEFPRLRRLSLEWVGSSGDEPQPQEGLQRVVVQFPALEHLCILCTANTFPFAEQIKFPRGVAAVHITTTGAAVASVADMDIEATKSITLSITGSLGEDGVLATAAAGRILARAQGCSKIEVALPGSVAHALPEGLESAALRWLCLSVPVALDAVLEQIQRLPNLDRLELGDIVLGDDQPGRYRLPAPGEPALAPLATGLWSLGVRFREEERAPELAIRAGKHMLLRIPTLAAFTSSFVHLPTMADFVRNYSAQYPHLAQVRLVPCVAPEHMLAMSSFFELTL